jgi:protein SCO1/2
MTISISRWTLLVVTVATLAFNLSGCKQQQRQAQVFNGIDVTGSSLANDIHLPDIRGQQRSIGDFKGKAVMVFFGFTQCPDVCPTALARAVEVKRLLGADGNRLQVLFVTVDPERDTPAVLKEYLAAFDPTFIALRGDAKRLATTAKDFKIFYQRVPTGSSYTMDHSAISYLFDPQGHLRLALSHKLSAPKYADDVRKLLHPI